MVQNLADGVGIDLSVRLCGEIEEGFGLAVELLQVQADRAIEREQVGPDRFTRGVSDAHAREAEHVLERTVNDQLAQRIEEPREQRNALAVEDLLAMAARTAEEGMKDPPLERARILHPDHHAGEHLLEHARRRK